MEGRRKKERSGLNVHYRSLPGEDRAAQLDRAFEILFSETDRAYRRKKTNDSRRSPVPASSEDEFDSSNP
jgi:hypothetical protein